VINRPLVAALALLAVTAICGARSAHAETASATLVREYFAALGSQRYDDALAQTIGQARAQTTELLDEIRRRAEERHARVVLRPRRLELEQQAGQVRARFEVDVLGKFAFFTKKVQTLRGEGAFTIADGRIVAIDGALAP
jgi:hypothetical protein